MQAPNFKFMAGSNATRETDFMRSLLRAGSAFFRSAKYSLSAQMVPVLAFRAFLEDVEWPRPYFFGFISGAIRGMMFFIITIGFLAFWARMMKTQEYYIRALIRLKISPKQKTKDESSVPLEFSESTPAGLVQKATSQDPIPEVPKLPAFNKPVLELPVPTVTVGYNSPENGLETALQQQQRETSSQRLLRDKILPRRNSPTPVCPLKRP
ncbi:hypothetical protein FBEOM_1530 [Fusarium beomiforme]|uniref:Uncharacterized protein n=1 Tax=Fusarium beomiforme TaxID=44412 RepID=A0A9P5E100_9HYPO|nr:hypothetical protein FBEOM_1530 [Fusarium beomiforme]